MHIPLANLSALFTLGASFYFFFWRMGAEGMAWSMIEGGLVLILALLVGAFMHQREVKF